MRTTSLNEEGSVTTSASKRELLGLLYTGLIGVLFFSGLLLLPPGPAAGLPALPSVSATATIQPSPTRTGGIMRTPTRAGTIPPPLTATPTRTPTNSPTVAPTRTCLPTGTIVPSPSQGTGRNVLSDVVVISPDDVWAVGAYGDFDDAQTITMHWDGSTWAIVSSPNADADS